MEKLTTEYKKLYENRHGIEFKNFKKKRDEIEQEIIKQNNPFYRHLGKIGVFEDISSGKDVKFMILNVGMDLVHPDKLGDGMTFIVMVCKVKKDMTPYKIVKKLPIRIKKNFGYVDGQKYKFKFFHLNKNYYDCYYKSRNCF